MQRGDHCLGSSDDEGEDPSPAKSSGDRKENEPSGPMSTGGRAASCDRSQSPSSGSDTDGESLPNLGCFAGWRAGGMEQRDLFSVAVLEKDSDEMLAGGATKAGAEGIIEAMGIMLERAELQRAFFEWRFNSSRRKATSLALYTSPPLQAPSVPLSFRDLPCSHQPFTLPPIPFRVDLCNLVWGAPGGPWTRATARRTT